VSKRKGCDAERELTRLLWEQGFGVVRSAGSGCTPHPNPDLLVVRKGVMLAVECKSTRCSVKYVSVQELRDLLEFCELSGAKPVLAVKFSRNGWEYFIVDKELVGASTKMVKFELGKGWRSITTFFNA